MKKGLHVTIGFPGNSFPALLQCQTDTHVFVRPLVSNNAQSIWVSKNDLQWPVSGTVWYPADGPPHQHPSLIYRFGDWINKIR